RANLTQRDAEATPPPAPSDAASSGSRPTLGSVRRARSDQADAPAEAQASAPGNAPEPKPAPAPAPAADAPTPVSETAAPTTAAASGPPSAAELTSAWDDAVLAALKPRARALFKPGHFVEGDGRIARFALPNPAHRDQCEPIRDVVAEALSAHFGRKVPLELVVDDAKTRPPSGPSTSAAPTTTTAPAGTSSESPDVGVVEDEAVDLDDLSDAPDATVGGVAQLKDAFPGAELLEES
ncbi:MAG: hypothetical protein OSA99_16610, partial [Acidimicrobiales bacterium]|nr:hypothetical protein [Acidimicrobiales bacterium]